MPIEPIRENVQGVGPAVGRELGVHRSASTLWDMSRGPFDNDNTRKDNKGLTNRDKKLGHQLSQRGSVITDLDNARNREIFADGLTERLELGGGSFRFAGSQIVGYRQWEPDNWVLRVHGKDNGFDAVWANRLIVDHREKHNTRGNRGTLIVDQRNKQRWGTTNEILFIEDVGVDTKDRALMFDDAAFLLGLRGKAFPSFQPKFHACFNINREAGFASDFCSIGQLDHVFKLPPDLKTATNRENKPLTTLCLPSSVVFHANPDENGPLAFGFTIPGGEGLTVVSGGPCGELPITDGEIYTGRHWFGPKTTQCEVSEAVCSDESEDGKQIARKFRKNIWVYVKMPRDWHGIPPTEVPPGFPDIPTGTRRPVVRSIGPAATLRHREDKVVGTGGTIPIPEDIPTGHGLNIKWNIFPSDKEPLGSTRAQVDAVVSKLGEPPDQLPRTATGAVDVPDNDFDNDRVESRAAFFLPHSFIKNAKGGKVYIAAYTRGDLPATTSKDAMHSAGLFYRFGTRVAKLAVGGAAGAVVMEPP